MYLHLLRWQVRQTQQINNSIYPPTQTLTKFPIQKHTRKKKIHFESSDIPRHEYIINLILTDKKVFLFII